MLVRSAAAAWIQPRNRARLCTFFLLICLFLANSNTLHTQADRFWKNCLGFLPPDAKDEHRYSRKKKQHLHCRFFEYHLFPSNALMTPVYIMRYKICVKRKLTQILSASVIIKVKIIRACFVSRPEHCSMASFLRACIHRKYMRIFEQIFLQTRQKFAGILSYGKNF